jgi:hypothetical protein
MMFSKLLGPLVFLVASIAAQIQEGNYHIFNAEHPTWSLQTLEGRQECVIASTNGIPPPRAEVSIVLNLSLPDNNTYSISPSGR